MMNSRKCEACGHVHPYFTPIYCCEACGKWGQDLYELRPISTPMSILGYVLMAAAMVLAFSFAVYGCMLA